MKPRINVYFDYDLLRQTDKVAATAGVSRSSLIDVALRQYLSPESADKREAAIIRRLDRLTRQLAKIDRDLAVTSEALGLFIHQQLSIAPPIPVHDEAAMRAKGRERFSQFVERLGQRIAGGRSLVGDVVETIQPTEADFYSIDVEDPANDN